MCGGKVEEIRRTAKVNGILRYIIDRSGSVKFVSPQEFISVSYGYRMIRVQ